MLLAHGGLVCVRRLRIDAMRHALFCLGVVAVALLFVKGEGGQVAERRQVGQTGGAAATMAEGKGGYGYGESGYGSKAKGAVAATAKALSQQGKPKEERQWTNHTAVCKDASVEAGIACGSFSSTQCREKASPNAQRGAHKGKPAVIGQYAPGVYGSEHLSAPPNGFMRVGDLDDGAAIKMLQGRDMAITTKVL